MGARGPAKKPAELEELHGNPGHRKINKKVQFDKSEEVPSPPPFLDKIAKKEWKRLAPKIFKVGLLTDGDLMTFAAYCECFSQWVNAVRAIQATASNKNAPINMTFETDKGYRQQIPEVGIANTAKKQMLTFAKEFGLTPSSRLDDTNADKAENDEASIMDFIKRKEIKKVKG